MATARQNSRKAKLYFNSNTDEFLLEEHLPELHYLRKCQEMIDWDNEVDIDTDALEEAEFETWESIKQRYQTVTVHYVSEEQMVAGTTKITRNILHG